MKKILLIFVLVLICPAWTTASNAVYDEVSALGKMISDKIPKGSKVAVTELVDLEGNVSSLGKFIAEELITELTVLNGKEITVIERRLMMKILEEQNLSVSELIAPSAIKNVGKLLGAGAIVTGTITELGDEVRVNARIVSTKTGEIESAARATIPTTGVVKKLMAMKSRSNLSQLNNSTEHTGNSQTKLFSRTWEGFDIKLSGCSKSSSRIQCKFVVTSIKEDNFGNKAELVSVKHGAYSGTEMGRYKWIYHEMIAGIPVKTNISFNLTDKEASEIAALKLTLSKSEKAKKDGTKTIVDFRSIPL
jgi:TolB-like protein